MDLRDILYVVEDGVGRITLNKPDKLNALSWGSWAEIETVIEAANEDDAVRCVVITGAGRGFSAGTDAHAVDCSDRGLGTIVHRRCAAVGSAQGPGPALVRAPPFITVTTGQVGTG